MKTKLLLFLILAMSYSTLIAQNTVKNTSKINPNTLEGYQYMSFTIYGLNSEEDKQALIQELESNQKLKNISVSEHNQFKGSVQKKYILEFKKTLKDRNLTTSMNNRRNTLAPTHGSVRIEIPENMKPVYKDTGRPEKDKQKYSKAKEQLLIEHPEFIQEQNQE